MASLPYDSVAPRRRAAGILPERRERSVEPRIYRRSAAGRVGYAVREFPRDCLLRLLEFPELPFRTSTRETIKAGRTALLVRAELPIGGRMLPVAYKRVRRRNGLKVLTALLRGNRTLRVWRLAHRFEQRGIATARPLAAVVPRWGFLGRESFLVTAWIEGACSLDVLLRGAGDAPECAQAINRAAGRLGELLGRMHAGRLSHRDLKVSNLLVRLADDQSSAYVIDLDGAAAHWRVGRRTRVRDLARLSIDVDLFPGVTAAQRLRFLKAYLSAGGDPGWEWKRAWRRLAAAGERLKARKGRGGQQ